MHAKNFQKFSLKKDERVVSFGRQFFEHPPQNRKLRIREDDDDNDDNNNNNGDESDDDVSDDEEQ